MNYMLTETLIEPLKIELENKGKIELDKDVKATLLLDSKGELEVLLGESSELTLIERVVGDCEKRIRLMENAKLNHSVIGVDISGEEKNYIYLEGRGCEVEFKQANIGRISRKIKTHAIHTAEETKSILKIRTVALDNAQITSIGKVIVNAQKSDSKLEDYGLMIGGKVTVIPAMEVNADDVHAGHANSVSTLDEENIFYLMSRGLSEKEARKTLIRSFLESVLGDNASEILDSYFGEAMNKEDFPVLRQKVNGCDLVYLDSAATSQKPKQVIEAVSKFYEEDNSNIHRGMHALSERATVKYEEARSVIAGFVNASPEELIFVRNATEGLNLLANVLGHDITDQDIILLTEMEHHSNIVPWKLLAQKTGAKIRWVPVLEDGTLDMHALEEELLMKPAIVAVGHVSNVLGTINPIKEIIEKAKSAIVVVDGAQSVPHLPVDVKALDCDALVFSGHKMMGPTGIGCVYVKKGLLNRLDPYMGGGGMIKEVSKEAVVYKDGPQRYEAGTPDISGAIGLAEAVKYLRRIGMYNIARHNMDVVQYALSELGKIPQVKLYGPEASKRAGAVAFTLGDMHGHDVSEVLNEYGIAIRAGHHCAQILMNKFNVADMCRASFHVYNSKEDVDKLVLGLKKAIEVFKL